MDYAAHHRMITLSVTSVFLESSKLGNLKNNALAYSLNCQVTRLLILRYDLIAVWSTAIVCYQWMVDVMFIG